MDHFLDGEGINILVECEPNFTHDWAAFALWYSVKKNLPEAKVAIACHREPYDRQYFNWATRCSVKYFMYKENAEQEARIRGFDYEQIFRFSPFTMAVRPYIKDSLGPVDVKNEELSTFVTYSEGVGKFVMGQRIHTNMAPFARATKRFAKETMTANEWAVLRLWDQMSHAFSIM